MSIAVPMGVQENASFIEDLDSLPNRKNLFSDLFFFLEDERCRVKVFQSTKRGGLSSQHRKSRNRRRGSGVH